MTLANSPADILRWLMIADSKATDPALGGSWPVYVSAEPDAPDSSITVYDTAGRIEGRVFTGDRTEHYGVMIRLRLATGQGFTVGWAKANDLGVWLDESTTQRSVTVGASSYLVSAVTRTGPVLPVGREPESGRRIFTLNAVITVKQN